LGAASDTIPNMLECPWTTSQLRGLSHHIRDGTPQRDGDPSYSEVMLWYNDLAAMVQKKIAKLNWPPLLRERPFEVTSRAKTLDTLREKLQRDPSTPLQSVQDIAGVRFEAEMSLDEQDAVATAICGFFDHDPRRAIHDLRYDPHSGYRGVHLWLRFPSRVEVQIRTHLQGKWANTYEVVADVIGRDIRYGMLPSDDLQKDIVTGMQEISRMRISEIERDRNEMATIALQIEEQRRRGNTEIPLSNRRRLTLLKRRNAKNEAELKDLLDTVHTSFNKMRAQRG
jgi:ppGpp synthetase/RelA/SpoT-type nucleotidyltranferase